MPKNKAIETSYLLKEGFNLIKESNPKTYKDCLSKVKDLKAKGVEHELFRVKKYKTNQPNKFITSKKLVKSDCKIVQNKSVR